MKYLIIFLIAFSGICLFACKNSETKTPSRDMSEVATTHVKTVPVENAQESNDVTALGIVLSESEAKPSFKTGGIIDKTYVKEGDVVKKGQLLATLLMNEINAQVVQSEENLLKAERDLNRTKNLYADSVATLEQLQNVKTYYEVAKRTAEIAMFNRNHSEIRSPIAGKIVKQIMRTGEITGPGTPVYAIMGISTNDWIVRAGLVDRDWARVKNGDYVTLTMDAYPGKKFEAFISKISSVGQNTSGTFDVEIKFKSQPSNLAAGLIARVQIEIKNKETFSVIPIEALVKSNGIQAYAFTIQNGKAKKINLKIAALMGDKVAISSGLEGVSEVVTTGAMYLEEGDVVNH